MNSTELNQKINLLKFFICKMCFIAKSGHPSSSLSCADIIGILYFDIMNHEIDKFMLSKGHAAPSLYAALMVKGDISEDLIGELRKIDSPLQGHTDVNRLPQVNLTTGALGQGLSFSIGAALSKKIKKENGYIYSLIGDGEVQEGQVWEAAMFAGNYKLDNLITFLDNNGGQSDGSIDEIFPIDPIEDKFKAFGWSVEVVNGHDVNEIKQKIENFKNSKIRKPLMIISKTKKGYINKNLSILNGSHSGLIDDHVFDLVKNELRVDK